jgi:hypothetical protein
LTYTKGLGNPIIDHILIDARHCSDLMNVRSEARREEKRAHKRKRGIAINKN